MGRWLAGDRAETEKTDSSALGMTRMFFVAVRKKDPPFAKDRAPSRRAGK